MSKHIEKLKKQLLEISEVVNSFRSEAVQVKVVDRLLDAMIESEKGELDGADAFNRRVRRNRQAEDDDNAPEEMELDLSAGELDKTSDPVRVYMREMGVVPLLKREQEVSIAKRIEWGQKRAQKGITRSPMAVAELLKVGAELEAGTLGIRDVVVFSDQMETEEHEDKTEEYLAWTIEGIGNIRKLYKRGLKELGQLNAEQKLRRGKASKKLTRLRRKVARTRLEIVHEIGQLHLKEAVRQRLITAIASMHRETRTLEREIEANTAKLAKKRIKAEDAKELKRQISVVPSCSNTISSLPCPAAFQ